MHDALSAAGLDCHRRHLPVIWNRPYFSCGLPVFYTAHSGEPRRAGLFFTGAGENAVEPSRWPELGFHRFSENFYAFRETFLFVGGVYPMIMRGRIVIDRRQRGIMMMVVGFLVPVAVIRPGETLMFSGFLVLAYLLQRSRFISVETAVHLLPQTNTTPLIPRGPDASRRASAD